MNKIPVLPVEVPEVVEGDSALPGPPDGRVEPEEEHLGEERGQLLRRRVCALGCSENAESKHEMEHTRKIRVTFYRLQYVHFRAAHNRSGSHP